MPRCSICQTSVPPETDRSTCPDCRQEYHRTCWEDLGGCATYGCPRAVPAGKPSPSPSRAGWGDAKTCPACRRELGSSLLLCSCGARFPYADPMSPEEYLDWGRRNRELSTQRRRLAWLFLGSLLGFPAPVLGAFAGAIAHRRRQELAGADGTYLAMGYGALALGATYLAIFAALVTGL